MSVNSGAVAALRVNPGPSPGLLVTGSSLDRRMPVKLGSVTAHEHAKRRTEDATRAHSCEKALPVETTIDETNGRRRLFR
jgi:hypothetical protein